MKRYNTEAFIAGPPHTLEFKTAGHTRSFGIDHAGPTLCEPVRGYYSASMEQGVNSVTRYHLQSGCCRVADLRL